MNSKKAITLANIHIFIFQKVAITQFSRPEEKKIVCLVYIIFSWKPTSRHIVSLK